MSHSLIQQLISIVESDEETGTIKLESSEYTVDVLEAFVMLDTLQMFSDDIIETFCSSSMESRESFTTLLYNLVEAAKRKCTECGKTHSGECDEEEKGEKEEMDEETLIELSTDLLARYKTGASKQATAADKAGQFKAADKRFRGIVKATTKQFGNAVKKAYKSTNESWSNFKVKTSTGDHVVYGPSDKNEMEKHLHGQMGGAGKKMFGDVRSMEPHTGKVADTSDSKSKRSYNESVELTELSKDTLNSYIDKKIAAKKKMPAGPEYMKAHTGIMKARRKVLGNKSVDKYPLGGYDSKSGRSYSESVEELGELKIGTLMRTVSKAGKASLKHGVAASRASDTGDDETAARERTMRDKRDNLRNKAQARISSKLAAKKAGVQEETEQIDELSKKTLGSYVNKAAADTTRSGVATGSASERSYAAKQNKDPERAKILNKYADKYDNQSTKRLAGIRSATKRLTKEETEQIDELSTGKLLTYANRAFKGAKEASKAAGAAASERNDQEAFNQLRKTEKRESGYQKAVKRLNRRGW